MNTTPTSSPERPTETGVKVSVLIPVYNGENYLAECLESVLAQDFAGMEILIADDDSKDGSQKIIEAFAARDPRIRWWKNPRNLGLTANANACLRQARGEYIKFVHQDDTLLATSALRRMVATLDENPSVVLVGSEPHVTGRKSRPIILSKKSRVYAGKEIIINCFEQNNNLIGQPTLTLFRKSVAQRGFDEHFTACMDYEMWCHLLEQGDFAYLAEPLATWRVHQNQQTARARASDISDHESLLLMEIYYAKPWLREAVTGRMLFAQIYYLRKGYGHAAGPLTRTMMAELSRHHYAWQWVKHKVSKPLWQLARKLDRG